MVIQQPLTKRQKIKILIEMPLYFVLAVIVGFLLLFQFTPFFTKVPLKDGGARISVVPSAEVVFYGSKDVCDVHGSGSGVWERPSVFEVSRMVNGRWEKPWAAVYNRYGVSKSGAVKPAAVAVVTCTDPNAEIWMTSSEGSWPFTQNTNMGSRYLLAGGAFFLAIVFLPYAIASIRYVITGKKPKKFVARSVK